MSRHHSDPRRASDPHALEDIEVFEVDAGMIEDAEPGTWITDALDDGANPADLVGWYWWSCLPGCLPEGDPAGPFDTEAAALDDATETANDFLPAGEYEEAVR